MVIDHLENVGKYSNLGDRIALALKYISETDFSVIEKGKYQLDGDLVYAAVSEYQTKPIADCKIEAHKKYIDVQYIISGEEAMGLTLLKDQQPSIPYNEEKDCVFYEEPTSLVNFKSGMFAIYFPHDLHQPCISINEGCTVKKVVVKVMV